MVITATATKKTDEVRALIKATFHHEILHSTFLLIERFFQEAIDEASAPITDQRNALYAAVKAYKQATEEAVVIAKQRQHKGQPNPIKITVSFDALMAANSIADDAILKL